LLTGRWLPRAQAVAAYSQGVGDAIDVVEPRCDQRDLQDRFIIEPDFAQSFVVFSGYPRSVLRQPDYVIQHCVILFADGGLGVVGFERRN
jgi:hypothetical protein